MKSVQTISKFSVALLCTTVLATSFGTVKANADVADTNSAIKSAQPAKTSVLSKIQAAVQKNIQSLNSPKTTISTNSASSVNTGDAAVSATNTATSRANATATSVNTTATSGATTTGSSSAATSSTDSASASSDATIEDPQNTAIIGNNNVAVNNPTDTHAAHDTATVDVASLGDKAVTFDKAVANGNKVLTKYNAGSSDIQVLTQGSSTVYYDKATGEAVIEFGGNVVELPKWGSIDVTDVNGKSWNIHNLGTGDFDIQDSADAKAQQAAQESVQDTAVDGMGVVAMGVAHKINLKADLLESAVAEPVNALLYVAMFGLAAAGMIPVVGIVPLLIDAVLLFVNSAWHGIQYAYSTARRTAVLAPATAIANVSTLGSTMNAIKQYINAKATGSARDQAVSQEAAKEAVLALLENPDVALATNGAFQAGTFVTHALAEGGFVLGELALGALGAIPIVGIIPLIGALALLTAHSAVNLGQRVGDEARRVAILGGQQAIADTSLLGSIGQSHTLEQTAKKTNNKVYTWQLANN